MLLKMKSIIITGLVVLLISGACIVNCDPHGSTHIDNLRQKRQETPACSAQRERELQDGIPMGCLEAFNTTNDASKFCSTTCGPALYEYLEECQAREARQLDVLCARNEDDDVCHTTFNFDSIFDDDSDLIVACGSNNDDDVCSTSCRMELETITQSSGCCIYSFAVSVFNESGVNNVFDRCGVDRRFCIGAFSFTGCSEEREQELQSVLPTGCLEAFDANTAYYRSSICSATCGPKLYKYLEECRPKSAQLLNLLCARNENDDICHTTVRADVFDEHSDVSIACNDVSNTCSTSCKNVIEELNRSSGCCLYSHSVATFGEDDTNFAYDQCNVERPNLCTGGFSACSPEREQELQDRVPEGCLEAYNDNDASTFCSTTCGSLLYEYFNECQPRNAEFLNIFCARNDNNDACYTTIDINILDDGSDVRVACNDTSICSASCKSVIQSITDSSGCCLYSYGVATFGESGVNSIFDECMVDRPNFCSDAFSTATCSPQKEQELQDRIPEGCLESFDANTAYYRSSICSATCGPKLYKYLEECRPKSAQLLNLLCARNENDDICHTTVRADVFDEHSDVSIACNDVSNTCSTSCKNVIEELNRSSGCCLYSHSVATFGEDDTNFAYDQCNVERPNLCTGGFSACSPEREQELQDRVPEGCLEAYNDNDASTFCSTTCGSLLYEYFNECQPRNAEFLNIFCARNDNNDACYTTIDINILDDGSDVRVACNDTSICSASCKSVIQSITDSSGCCLYSYGVATFGESGVNSIFDECMVDRPNFCSDAFSTATCSPQKEQELQERIPEGCLQAYANNNAFIFCGATCGSLVYEYFKECQPSNAQLLNIFCGRNDNNDVCHTTFSTDVFDSGSDVVVACNDTSICSASCRNTLEAITQRSGCCFYSYAVAIFDESAVNDVYDQCDISRPNLCPEAFSIASAATFTTMSPAALLISFLILGQSY